MLTIGGNRRLHVTPGKPDYIGDRQYGICEGNNILVANRVVAKNLDKIHSEIA